MKTLNLIEPDNCFNTIYRTIEVRYINFLGLVAVIDLF